MRPNFAVSFHSTLYMLQVRAVRASSRVIWSSMISSMGTVVYDFSRGADEVRSNWSGILLGPQRSVAHTMNGAYKSTVYRVCESYCRGSINSVASDA